MKASVVVLTYNADFNKLKLTLESIIRQDYNDFEIVIADDGSKIRWDDEIVVYLKEKQFNNYIIANSPENVGTVKNIANAVAASNGEYVKLISPGDTLYDSETLRKWVDFMLLSGADVSFGDAVYYNETDGKVNMLQQINSPMNLSLYDEPINRNKMFVNYLLGNDGIVGATIMYKRDVLVSYINRIVDKVKYAEDYMLRIMVFDNLKILHFHNNAIWYEYGGGISTGKNNKWAQILHKDFDETNKIIQQTPGKFNGVEARYIKYLSNNKLNDKIKKVYKVCMFPSVVYWRLKAKYKPSITATGDVNKLIELMGFDSEDK